MVIWWIKNFIISFVSLAVFHTSQISQQTRAPFSSIPPTSLDTRFFPLILLFPNFYLFLFSSDSCFFFLFFFSYFFLYFWKGGGRRAPFPRVTYLRGRTYVMITYVSKENNLGPDDKIRYIWGLKAPIFNL